MLIPQALYKLNIVVAIFHFCCLLCFLCYKHQQPVHRTEVFLISNSLLSMRAARVVSSHAKRSLICIFLCVFPLYWRQPRNCNRKKQRVCQNKNIRKNQKRFLIKFGAIFCLFISCIFFFSSEIRKSKESRTGKTIVRVIIVIFWK